MAGRISLTFDDGMDCQLRNAVPALDRRGLPGTFFLCASKEQPEIGEPLLRDWLDVLPRHEIGSHSVRHLKAATLDAANADYEARASKQWLKEAFSSPITSFCYPYTDAPKILESAVWGAGYKQARGGRVASPNKYLKRGDGANLLNVTCFHVGPETVKDQAKWLSELWKSPDPLWLTLMFHGIGDERKWDNISTEQFEDLLDAILDITGLRTVTFAEGAEWYRSGK